MRELQRMKKALCVLLSGLLLLGILSGCGSGQNEDPAANSTSPSVEEGSGSGSKDITYALNTTSWNTLLPWYAETTNSWMIQDVLYEPLCKGGDGELTWRAAESIEVLEDGYSWLVHLRKDVVWHDGEPCTAEDWVWSIQTVTNPDFGVFNGSTMFSSIEGTNEIGFVEAGQTLGMELVDDYTFSIQWKAPNSIDNFAGGLTFRFRAVPKHLLGDVPVAELSTNEFWQHPVGNGCCIFAEEPVIGQELRLKANKDFYLGTPEFDNVTYVVVDSTNMANAFLSGTIDVSNASLSKDIREELEGQNGIHSELDTCTRTIRMMCINNSKFDAKTRKALSMLIDKQMLVDAIAFGDGEPQGDNVLTYLDCYVPYEHVVDVEGAKALLEEANFDFDNTVIRLGFSSSAQNVAMIIQQNWAAAGVKSEIVTGEQTSLQSMQASGENDCYFCGWFEKYDPCAQANEFGPETGIYIHTDDSKYVDLADQIHFCADPQKKLELQKEWQLLLREECPILFLYSTPSYVTMSSKLEGGVLSGMMDMPWLWKLA